MDLTWITAFDIRTPTTQPLQSLHKHVRIGEKIPVDGESKLLPPHMRPKALAELCELGVKVLMAETESLDAFSNS